MYMSLTVKDYKASYSDPEGTIPHTQPIILTSRGEYPGMGLYLINDEAYTLELRDLGGVVVKTVNDVTTLSGESILEQVTFAISIWMVVTLSN